MPQDTKANYLFMSNGSELPNEQAPRRLRWSTHDRLMRWKLSVDVAPPPPHHLPEAMSHISFNNSLLHAQPDKRRAITPAITPNVISLICEHDVNRTAPNGCLSVVAGCRSACKSQVNVITTFRARPSQCANEGMPREKVRTGQTVGTGAKIS